MRTRRLSVVLPTHNRAGQLARAAASVLTQGFPDIELVIVDDGSTDDTPEVIDRLSADPRVRIVGNEEPRGPGGARNQGIDAAQGELLGFCDADDEWLPGAANILVGHLESDRQLGAVTSWHRVIPSRTAQTVDYRGPLEFGADELLWFNFVALPFVVRRCCFPGLQFDEDLPACEDWDLLLRCAQLKTIEAVPHVLYARHQHGGPRATSTGSGHRRGRRGFLEKHGAIMTPACRIYHQAVLTRLARGRKAMVTAVASEARDSPVTATTVGSALALSYTAAAVGRRRKDPGLPARSLCRFLRWERPGSWAGGSGHAR